MPKLQTCYFCDEPIDDKELEESNLLLGSVTGDTIFCLVCAENVITEMQNELEYERTEMENE